MPPAGFEPKIERPQAHVLDLTHCLRVINYTEIVTGLRARRPRNRGLNLGRRNKFLLLRFVQTGPGAHPASYSVGTEGGTLFPGVNRLGCEAYLPFQCRAKFKNEWRYTSTLPHAFLGRQVQCMIVCATVLFCECRNERFAIRPQPRPTVLTVVVWRDVVLFAVHSAVHQNNTNCGFYNRHTNLKLH